MGQFYILVLESAVFTKEAEFFKQQGGLVEAWGRGWEKVEAMTLEDARMIAIDRRRARYPHAYRTYDE